MNRPKPEDVAFHGCAAATVAALAVLYALRFDGPLRRWLDRRIDAATTLPAPAGGRS